ncbi:MAG: 3-dehydroquinate synthase [Candidatus Omnitrophota bacterium]
MVNFCRFKESGLYIIKYTEKAMSEKSAGAVNNGPIVVNLKDRSYKVIVKTGLEALPVELRRLGLGPDAVLITNPKINALFARKVREILKRSGLNVSVALVPDSERAKSLREAIRLLRFISRMDGLGKKIFIIALGGGVVGDLAGFVASVYKRGIPYIQIPTTLLSQVDSSIGGKVAVDLPEGKNLAGSFYQPRIVYIDVSFIRHLSDRDFRSGFAEIIKYAVIKDKKLFEFLKKNKKDILNRDLKCLIKVISRCAEIKSRIVSADEKEQKSIRTALNLGHTIGHAIETACGYSGFYSHGEAVGIGMILAARLSNCLGSLSENDLRQIEDLIKFFGLPSAIKGRVSVDRVLKSLAHDKKFIHGVTRFVLPLRIGKVFIREQIPESMIREELNKIITRVIPANVG